MPWALVLDGSYSDIDHYVYFVKEPWYDFPASANVDKLRVILFGWQLLQQRIHECCQRIMMMALSAPVNDNDVRVTLFRAAFTLT